MFSVEIRHGSLPDDLGVSDGQAHPVGQFVLSARIDVPPGEWLIWTNADQAMWVGGRADSLPGPVRRRLEGADTDAIPELIDALADVGVWLREAAVLVDDHWAPSRRVDAVLNELVEGAVSAISGVFIDQIGRSARLEMRIGAVCWTDRPALAIEWLLTAFDLEMPR